jgi:aryl-phospho-beta-D-glucosidase BglC (GH1 family)
MMLVLDGPGGKKWLQHDGIQGTFDWKEIAFIAAIPEDITEAMLMLGMENTTGTVWFDDIKMTVIGKKPTRPADKPTAPAYKGHELPRLRGVMIQPDSFKQDDLDLLAGKWKANHVRWQLLWNGFPNGPADTATVEEFDAWIDKQCEQLDKMLPELERYGVRVTLDLHTPPGGRLPQDQGSAMRMFQEKKFQDAFVAVWQKLARKYKDTKMIWCYDILNEAVEGEMSGEAGILPWRELALKTSKEIRKIDPVKAIVIEPAPWGSPDALEWLEPFDPKEMPNVVYSVHMYQPHKFTHQGVYDTEMSLVYPGKIDGKDWDKEQIRKSLQVVKDFAADYGVAIYIGEFGSIRWAPENSSYRYLKDCIEIFEEEGWDWAYHAFREWDGWSVEHSSDKNDRQRVTELTDRELLLRSWFEKNER